MTQLKASDVGSSMGASGVVGKPHWKPHSAVCGSGNH